MTTKINNNVTVEQNIDNVVFTGILSVIGNKRSWSGTMTELNTALTRVLGRKTSSVLPGSPSALRVVLNRVVNRLRNKSVSVRFARTNERRFVKFSR